MAPIVNATRIKEALSLVHYWEHRDRGPDRRPTGEACADAIRILALSEPEARILRNALLVEASHA